LAHRRPQKKRDCPDEDRLRLLLPGQVEPEEAETLLTHAAECDWCGTVLRDAARDLTEPPTGEEEELAGRARLADPRGRRELVERIVPPKRPDPKPWILIFRRLAPAAGLAALLLVGGVSYEQWTRSPAHSERLLAEAYTKRRQMDVRVPGAEWGRMRTEMGPGSSSLNEPRELLAAKLNISRGREAHPDDPRWLQLAGEAELLDGKEGAAIADLERARELRPADATILADLGAAYFQKAENAGVDGGKEFSSAYDSFVEGLRLKPRDPTLLFDQALAAERIYAYGAARKAWDDYLTIDPKSGFAREARAHLDKVKKNLMGSGPTPPPPLPTR
jgi:hypothetical protein